MDPSPSVSRILSTLLRQRRIRTRQPFIWAACCHAARATYPNACGIHRCRRTPLCTGRAYPLASVEAAGNGIPTWSCSGRGLPSRDVAIALVRSYRTISPLPFDSFTSRRLVNSLRAVSFLLHFPSPCGARLLAGALPCGVRTFLPQTSGITGIRRRLPDVLGLSGSVSKIKKSSFP